MALKTKGNKTEVRHVFLSNTTEELDKIFADWLLNNWTLVEARMVNIDWNNRIFSVFYIISRGIENVE